MNTKKLDYYKEKLRAKEDALNATVQRTESYGREKDLDPEDMGDMAVKSYTKELMFGKSSVDRRILVLIREALDRIEDKSFGVCLHCEDPIEPKRLEAVPWAQYCLPCQSLFEKGLLDNN